MALGVFGKPADVPLPRLLEAGVPVALGADDPLLFGSRLTAQYELARDAHGFGDAELAELARMSVRGRWRPSDVRRRLLAGIDAWLAAMQASSETPTSTGSGLVDSERPRARRRGFRRPARAGLGAATARG